MGRAGRIFIALFLLCGWARATAPLADRVPGDAVVYVGWRGANFAAAEFANSHLKAVLDDSRLRDFVNTFIPQLIQLGTRGNSSSGESFEAARAALAQMWKYPTAFYAKSETASAGPNAPMQFAVICQAGADTGTLVDALNKFIASAPPDGHFSVAISGDVVILASEFGTDPAAALATPAASLASDVGFRASLAQVQENAVFVSYLNIEKLLQTIDATTARGGNIAQQTPAFIDALGIRGIKHFASSAGFDGRDWMNQTFIDVPAPRAGIFAGLNAQPIAPEILKAIPADATFAAAFQFDAGALVSRVRAAAKTVGPPLGQYINQAVGVVQIGIGEDLQQDLLGPLGTDWAMYASPSTSGNGVLESVIVNHPKDANRAANGVLAAVTRLAATANSAMSHGAKDGMHLSVLETRVGEIDVHYIGLPIIAPAWALADGNLYFGLYPQPVISAVRQTQRNADQSFADSEKFQSLQKRLGVSSVHSFTFYDVPAAAAEGGGYQQMMMLIRYFGFADIAGTPLPEPLLPPLDDLRQHVIVSGAMSWVDDAGYHAKDISAFPGSTLLSSGGGLLFESPMFTSALGASVMLPSLDRARETANRVKCAANMRSIGQAMLLYANDNRGGKFPDTLGVLILTEDIASQSFICPSTNTQMPVGLSKEAQALWADHGDYVYLGRGKTNAVSAETPLLYEKDSDHDDGSNILFGDGHVEFVSRNRVHALIGITDNGVKRE